MIQVCIHASFATLHLIARLAHLQKDDRIDKQELKAQYDVLDHKPRPNTEYGLSEVEDIIWEVDEDANGWIDWENFVQLYLRCRKDRTGREPTRLFNLIEFMICDKDGGGTMSEDECMEILYHRFGKEVRAAPCFLAKSEARADYLLVAGYERPHGSVIQAKGRRSGKRVHLHGVPEAC